MGEPIKNKGDARYSEFAARCEAPVYYYRCETPVYYYLKRLGYGTHISVLTHQPCASILDMFKRALIWRWWSMSMAVCRGSSHRPIWLEATTGDLPDVKHSQPEDGSFLVDGAMSIYDAQQRFDLGTLPDGDFNTLAGFVVFLFNVPAVGERVESHGWTFEVSDMEGWRINKVLARRVGADGESSVVDQL